MKNLCKIAVMAMCAFMVQSQCIAQVWTSLHNTLGAKAEMVVEVDNGSHYLAIGQLFSSYGGYSTSNFTMIKYDTAGNEVFAKTYGPFFYVSSKTSVAVTERNDGGYLIVANLYNDDLQGEVIAFILTDEMGDLQSYELLNDLTEGSERAEKVAFLEDDSFILAGVRTVGTASGLFVRKINEDLTTAWENNFLGSVLNTSTAIATINDNEFVLITSSGGENVMLTKATMEGELLWTKSYPAIGKINDLVANGTYLVGVGDAQDDDPEGWRTNGLVMVMDEYGDTLAVKRHTHTAPTFYRSYKSILALPDNNYAIAGTSGNLNIGLMTDAYLARIDVNGDVLAEHEYWVSWEGTMFNDIIMASDGNIVGVGQTQISDVVGQEKWFALKTGDILITTVPLQTNTNNFTTKAYPNPTNTTLLLESNGAVITQIVAFNSLGQTCFKQSFANNKQVQLTTNQWENGNYVLKVYTDKGVVHKKIQVLH